MKNNKLRILIENAQQEIWEQKNINKPLFINETLKLFNYLGYKKFASENLEEILNSSKLRPTTLSMVIILINQWIDDQLMNQNNSLKSGEISKLKELKIDLDILIPKEYLQIIMSNEDIDQTPIIFDSLKNNNKENLYFKKKVAINSNIGLDNLKSINISLKESYLMEGEYYFRDLDNAGLNPYISLDVLVVPFNYNNKKLYLIKTYTNEDIPGLLEIIDNINTKIFDGCGNSLVIL